MSRLGTRMRRVLVEDSPADDVPKVAPPSKSSRAITSASAPRETTKLTYPPTLHENLDIPYGQMAEKVAKPYFDPDPETSDDVIDRVHRKFNIGTVISISPPTLGATSVYVPTRQMKGKSAEPPNNVCVTWTNGCMSWHSMNGEYLVTEHDLPNFVAFSGAQLWLNADGSFRHRGEKRNYMNSCGFGMVLNPEGTLKELSVTDINGENMEVDETGVISQVYLPRPLHVHANAWKPDDLDLPYRIRNEKLEYILTAIVGPLSHPVFKSNGKLPNLVTIGTSFEDAVEDKGGDTHIVTVHHVQGFPYVHCGDWKYVGLEDLDGFSRITMTFANFYETDPISLMSEYAVDGELVKTDLKNPIWSPECSKYAIIQVGPTCASTAILNLILCCSPLRNYCVKVINGYLASQEDFKKLATLSRWHADILRGENLMETILHAVYKRLCGATVGTPETLLLSGLCLYAQTFQSSRYKDQPKFITGIHRSGQLVVDFLRSIGLHSGLMHAPADRMIPAKYDYLLRFGSSKQLAPLSVGKFVLVGCVMNAMFKVDGHAITGVICDTGERILFDSNFGEAKLDWLDKRVVHEYYKKTYNETDINMHQILLYMSTAFIDAHGHHVTPCLSTAAEDMVNVVPYEHSSNDLTTLARAMYPTHFGEERKPYSIAAGELESNSSKWRRRP